MGSGDSKEIHHHTVYQTSPEVIQELNTLKEELKIK